MQGFDDDTMEFQFIAIDPERVGLENIEVPQVCDFGDNQLDYMTRRRHRDVGESTDVKDDDYLDIDNDDDECDAMSDCSSSSEDSTASIKSDRNDYHGILPAKFIAFLKS